MSIIKKSKFWSTLALVASVLSVLAMAAIMFGYRGESFTFREASGHLRTAAQVSVYVLGFCALVALLSFKNKGSLIKSLVAIVIVLTPLMIMKNNMPAGTALFAAAPAGPPPGAGAMAAGGMAPGGMAMGAADPGSAPVNDVTTDTQNPPAFSAVIPLRPEGSNSVEYAGPQLAAAQAVQFPDIKPITSSLSKTAAFSRALEVVSDIGWEIIAQDENSGVIEAVASTRFFNFQDDVVIRVSESDASSIIDVRSRSRIGRGDRGKNAERVRDFIARF